MHALKFIADKLVSPMRIEWKIVSTLSNPNAHWTAKLHTYCHVFLHLVTRKNGVSELGVVVGGVLALEVYPRYAAAAFSEGKAA